MPAIEGSGLVLTPGSGAPLKPGEFILGYPDEQGPPARYLVEQGYIVPSDATSEYVITVAGFDRVREMRGIDDPSAPAERSGMSDKTQQRLLTLLSIAISIGLSQPLARFIGEKIPERRGIRDDLTEAVLQGLVRAVALVVASVIVRALAASRR